MVKGKDITIKNTTPQTVVRLKEEDIINMEQAIETLKQFTKDELIKSILDEHEENSNYDPEDDLEEKTEDEHEDDLEEEIEDEHEDDLEDDFDDLD